MVRGKAVATVAVLQARARGGEGSAPIVLAGYDPVLVTRASGLASQRANRRIVPDYAPRFIAEWFARIPLSAGFTGRESAPSPGGQINLGAQDKRLGGPPSQPAGTGSDALVREGDGGEIASSVPAEIRVQSGHSGTWIASSVPAEVRARAQTAYEQAYTRAYRAYLGTSPAAGDPTATVRAGGTADCPKCPTTGRSQCCCKFCISNDQQHTVRTRVSLDCKTGMTEILPGTEWNPPPEGNLCSCSFVVEGTAASFGGFGGGSSGDPSEDECTTGQASQPGWTCYIMCGGSSKTDQEWPGQVQQGVSCNCLPYSPFCIGAKMSCEECRSAAEAMASGYSQNGKIPLYCCPKPDAGFCDELQVACPCKCPPPGNCDRR